MAELIGLVLTALPDRFQSVLRAKYQEHLPVAEIARRWGESAKAVESLLARARAAFRQAYVRLNDGS
jgi:RNA polymerase sigma-70 factor (ECF subfamily)